jgi:hypothetical protein
MADLDTRLKRQSASNLLLPFTIPGVYSSFGSGIIQAEMQAVSGVYSGILAVLPNIGLDNRLKRQSASNLLLPFTIPSIYPNGPGITQPWQQAVSWLYSGILAPPPVILLSDTFYGLDPTARLTSTSDMFMNSPNGGDVWYDVLNDEYRNTAWDILHTFKQNIAWDILNDSQQNFAWDILHTFAQTIAWDILNASDQDFSWSVFAQTLYYIQRFLIKQICFDFGIKEPVDFDWEIYNPLEFTYIAQSSLINSMYLKNMAIDTIRIANPTQYSFQIYNPLDFTFIAQGSLAQTMHMAAQATIGTIGIKELVQYTFGIDSPLSFTYRSQGDLSQTVHLSGVSTDTINIKEPVQYNFQIYHPLDFTFIMETSDKGSQEFVKGN